MSNLQLGVIIWGAVLTACGDDGEPVAPASVARHAPTITSVVTSDGFTQICMGCTADIVITGDRLARTRSVILPLVGEPEFFIVATILHTSNTQVRARVAMPHGVVVSFYDLAISGPQGDAIAANALEVTIVVASPSGSPRGRGTFQSPMRLCDPRLDDQLGPGDGLLLLAGVHTCDRVLAWPSGVEVVGEGRGVTRVVGQGTGTGFHFRPGPFNSASRVDDLTIEGTIAAPSISVDSAGLHVNNVDDHGGGIVVVHGNQPRVDNYLFDGPGRGMVIDATDGGRLANITIQNCSEGVTLTGGLSPGAVTTEVLGMTIKHCGLGLRLGTLPQTPGGPPPSFQGFVQDIHLIDNAIAILVQDGDSFVSNAVIEDDPTTPAVPATAVRVENGSLNLSFTQITGHTAGLDVDTLATAGRGRVVAGFVSIVGGDVGMRLRAFDRGTSVTFGGLDIRDQTTAALQVDGVEILDTFGPNTLSVLSGFAIDDRRTVIQPDRTELGLVRTTLNGHSYAGQVLRGPLSIGSDIRIASPDAVWGFQGP